MTTLVLIVTLCSLFVPLYVYAGYPVLLYMLARFVGKGPARKGEIFPRISLIVSCYNEYDVIEAKIKNCLELEYPADKLKIIFVSDGSDDGTDEVIHAYRAQGVALLRQENRLGKTTGLNRAVSKASGGIIVFSDANAMYQPNAIGKLVRSFNDPDVGYVVGAALYRDESATAAGVSESVYWKYEIFLKRLESELHSVVGGDGAIYAIRKHLYRELDPEDINDFVNPLQIIMQGYRGIFEPDAVCYEETAGSFDKEGRRKQRIVNRSFNGLLKCKAVLNPFRFGFFTFEIVSHKLLRWLIPLFGAISTLGILVLALMQIYFFQLVLLLGILFVWVVMLGACLKDRRVSTIWLLYPYYFYIVNYNSMLGVLQSLRGEVQITWNSSRQPKLEDDVVDLKLLTVQVGIFLVSVALFLDTLVSIL